MRRQAPESHPSWFWVPLLAFAAAVLPPVLLTRVGAVTVHERSRVLVDPAAALRDALSVWEPDRALGTVAADDLSRAWPLGAFHWVADVLAIPTWLAQRLWLAGILLAACGGVLYLARAWRWRPAAGAAAAFTYALAPFVVAGAVEPEALLPFAGLPWLVALTVLGLRHRGWRHPALFGLVLATVASSDAAAALVLVAAPLAWAAHAVWVTREATRSRAASTLTKFGIVTVAVNLWWVAGRTVQVTNGVDAARFVGPPDLVNGTSSATEIVRGLGRWTAYASDAATSARYTQQTSLLVASFVVPVIAVLALGVARWRHRTFAIGLVVVGAVLAVGAHPIASPSPYGALVRALERTDPGLALRGLQEAVVLVVLGAALGVGALVGAAGESDVRRGIAGAAAAFAVAATALAPLWTGDLVPGDAATDELVPPDLTELARALDEGDDGTRVLELPAPPPPDIGATAAPAGLSAVLDRGYVARRSAPSGSAATADLLRAVDRGAQDGTLAPEALAPMARLLGVGDVVVRPDRAPGPQLLERAGLDDVRTVGGARTAPVDDPVPVVRTHVDDDIVVLSGSGAGIVDAAAAGLLEGDELIRYSSELTDDPDFVRTHLRGDRTLVVTDTNRARAERWTDVRDVDGYTEGVDGGVLDDDPFDHRLTVQDGRPGTQTVTETGALSVRATGYGPDDRYAPEHRPVHAADGDAGTAWLVETDGAVGERVELIAAEPVTTDEVRLLQGGDGAIDRVALRFDDDDQLVVDLDDRSRQGSGQVVDIGERTLSRLGVEIRSLTPTADPGGAVGFAEVGWGGLVADEYVRMPSDLLDAAGFRSSRYPLALVQTRLRSGPGAPGEDEERAIRRIADLPATRPYALSGRAHPHAGATPPLGECRDDLVAVDGVPVSVLLLAGGEEGGDLRLEGCAPDGTAIAGGERRFTTAPGEATGVHVDQLVWASPPMGGTAGPDRSADAPELRVTGESDSTVGVEVSGADPGEPFWLLFAQSHDRGWEVLDVDAEVDGPHLVNGYANGFLVTPETEDLALDIRFVPQNRVDVALLVSVGAALVALVLALLPASEVRPASIAGQEPLRRLRALTYEGALPTRRDAIVVALIGGIGGTLLAGPLVGAALAVVGGFATRREGWRPAFTVGPALLLTAAAAAVVLTQVERDLPHSYAWPAETGAWHRVALGALLLLGLDLVIDHVWRRRSLYD